MSVSAMRAATEATRRQINSGFLAAIRSGASALGQHQVVSDKWVHAQHAALPNAVALPNAFAAPISAPFDLGFAVFGQQKSQGEEATEDGVAENPRNDVPPVSPGNESSKVPASPDSTNSKANESDYTSPGTHPANTKRSEFKPDMDNASPAVTQRASSPMDLEAHMREAASCGGKAAKAAARAQKSAGVLDAPVEALLENNQSSSDRTGPASHDDDPPGVDKDPNVIPPKQDDSDQKKVDKADKEAWKAMSL